MEQEIKALDSSLEVVLSSEYTFQLERNSIQNNKNDVLVCRRSYNEKYSLPDSPEEHERYYLRCYVENLKALEEKISKRMICVKFTELKKVMLKILEVYNKSSSLIGMFVDIRYVLKITDIKELLEVYEYVVSIEQDFSQKFVCPVVLKKLPDRQDK